MAVLDDGGSGWWFVWLQCFYSNLYCPTRYPAHMAIPNATIGVVYSSAEGPTKRQAYRGSVRGNAPAVTGSWHRSVTSCYCSVLINRRPSSLRISAETFAGTRCRACLGVLRLEGPRPTRFTHLTDPDHRRIADRHSRVSCVVSFLSFFAGAWRWPPGTILLLRPIRRQNRVSFPDSRTPPSGLFAPTLRNSKPTTSGPPSRMMTICLLTGPAAVPPAVRAPCAATLERIRGVSHRRPCERARLPSHLVGC